MVMVIVGLGYTLQHCFKNVSLRMSLRMNINHKFKNLNEKSLAIIIDTRLENS